MLIGQNQFTSQLYEDIYSHKKHISVSMHQYIIIFFKFLIHHSGYNIITDSKGGGNLLERSGTTRQNSCFFSIQILIYSFIIYSLAHQYN